MEHSIPGTVPTRASPIGHTQFPNPAMAYRSRRGYGPQPMQYAYTRPPPRARRPMDKLIKAASLTASSAAQTATVLATATYPGTIVGLRWNGKMAFHTNAGTVPWAIVVVREGASADTLSVADGAAVYQPEQNVLAAGVEYVLNGDPVKFEGDTKAMRKLQGGDQLQFICFADAVDVAYVRAQIQFFVKT